MTTRRDFLRAGLVTAATALVIPDERFVRRFFPVGIDLRRTRTFGQNEVVRIAPLHYPSCIQQSDIVLLIAPGSASRTVTIPEGWRFA